jgi:hypothetical protein
MKTLTIETSVKNLRRGYNDGRATGVVDVAGVGLTYLGRPIAALDFQRFNVVDYVGADGKRLARFQDTAAIDD